MAGVTNGKEVLRRSGAEARALGGLMVAATGLVGLSLALPHPKVADLSALVLIAGAMLLGGLLCFAFARRLPGWSIHAILAGVVVLTGLLIYESGVAAGQYGAIFVWAMLIAAYFFPRRLALAHLAGLLAVYALTLALVGSTAGYSVFTRWTFTAVSLSVVTVMTSEIVTRRARADLRARRFFELSRDMLGTSNMDGYFIELNSAWESCLGYSDEELRAKPFIEFVHPEDRGRTEAEAAALFEGSETVAFENRYLAKDGSWHWLRWSSILAADESLIYGRASDVTELKRIESEREDLLIEVRMLASSDALTGLPNRRSLDEQLPREMARARRHSTPLCLAIIDIDFFKAYNDAHGHLAGDGMLRDCAEAWDSELRGEDTIIRYGGEEFLVLLPGASLDQAADTVERLRAVTPDGQTCSAGLACWDLEESAEDLLERADVALYAAKNDGRDRLAF
jgi:diguanylate cyclase (GGDEF)-like protein/PAS domain S-box-containing protein